MLKYSFRVPFDTRKSLHSAEALVLHTSTRPSLLFSKQNVLKASSSRLFSVSQLLPILSFHTNERESRQGEEPEPQLKSQRRRLPELFLAFKFTAEKSIEFFPMRSSPGLIATNRRAQLTTSHPIKPARALD